MKIVTINGQNHKGSTYHIGRMLAEKITSPDEITEIFLPRDMSHFCVGCTQCFADTETKCPHYGETQPLTKLMDEADVLIFTSPVYVFHATGSMKAFLDHYGYRWMVHRPEEKMFSKQAVVISTAAGGGMKSTCKDMAHNCFFWGIGKTYKYGVGVRAVSWDGVPEKIKSNIAGKTDNLASKIKHRAGRVKPGIKTKGFFAIMRMVHRKGFNEADDNYWKEKGWFDNKRPW